MIVFDVEEAERLISEGPDNSRRSHCRVQLAQWKKLTLELSVSLAQLREGREGESNPTSAPS